MKDFYLHELITNTLYIVSAIDEEAALEKVESEYEGSELEVIEKMVDLREGK